MKVRSMNKRLPTLADRFMWGGVSATEDVMVSRKIFDATRNRLRSARRFVFTEEASFRVGKMIRDIPDLIARHQDFARAPYDNVWIEIHHPSFYRGVTGGVESDGYSDWEIGYLIDHDVTHVVMGGTRQNPGKAVGILPITYHLHEPWDLSEQLDFCSAAQTSRMQLDAFLWGRSFFDMPDADRHVLRDHHTARIIPGPKLDARKYFHNLVAGSSGDLRNIIGLLLLLNRPALTRYVRDEARFSAFHHGKLRSYMTHTVVEMPVDPTPIIRLVGTREGEGVERRRHEVRGTYCHDATARRGSQVGCDHNWAAGPDKPDSKDHWVCSACQGRRWWRQSHQRGSAEKGWVTKTYSVTA